MNEGYRLTDFTLEELSELNTCISKSVGRIKARKQYTTTRIELLYELQTRVLTAFSIVKEREKATGN